MKGEIYYGNVKYAITKEVKIARNKTKVKEVKQGSLKRQVFVGKTLPEFKRTESYNRVMNRICKLEKASPDNVVIKTLNTISYVGDTTYEVS